MTLIPYTFLFDALLVLCAISLAFGQLRVWWSYILAGEMLATLGLSMVFHYFYTVINSVDAFAWYYIYAISQCIVLVALLFSLTKRRFIVLYLLSASVSLITGMTVNDYPLSVAAYPFAIGLLDILKVGFMASYWHSYVRGGSYSGGPRIHVCQD